MADRPRYRILQVVASSRGGGAVHVRTLALALAARGHQVQVAMAEDEGTVSRQDFAPAAIGFTPLPIATGISRTALSTLRHLYRTVDLVHLHGARAALFGRLAALSLGRARPRLVYTIHGYAAPYYGSARRYIQVGLERSLASVTNRWVAVCQAEKEALVASGVAPASRVAVVWNGIDVDAFALPPDRQAAARAALRQELRLPPDAPILLTVCRLYKPRDFPTLFRAFAQARAAYPTAHLLIVGDGPYRSALAAQVEQMALGRAITFTGWRSDLPALYAASDLYTLTTWGWEGLPLTVLEAMAAGLPVAATCAGGVPEAVVDGETGILAERQNIASLEDAFRRLLADEALRRRMGEAGRRRAQAHFRVETMVERIDRLYRELLARS